MEVRSVDKIVQEEPFSRVGRRVVGIRGGLAARMSGPLQELFEH